jgi:small subunit ribosomal protein S21
MVTGYAFPNLTRQNGDRHRTNALSQIGKSVACHHFPEQFSVLTGERGKRTFSPSREEVCSLAEVVLNEGESLESALRRFKRKVQQEDIIKDVKKHSFYLKPGEKKRIKQALARKRLRKKMRNYSRT